VDDDPVKYFLHETKSAIYAAAQFISQFHTHIYSILIVKDAARIIRRNRLGAIVTEAIQYNQSPFLIKFFCHYSKASPEMCGEDQSVSDPTPTEAAAAQQALKIADTELLIKLAIPDVDGHNSLFYVTTAPQATPYPPPGCTTCGFQAYDIL
jgi:hypothetical protein